MAVGTGPGTELERLRAPSPPWKPRRFPILPKNWPCSKPLPASPVPAPPVAVINSANRRPTPVAQRNGCARPRRRMGRGSLRRRQDPDAGRALGRHRQALRCSWKKLSASPANPNNLYVLCSLASVQYDERHLDDCEKTARQAIALDPMIPAAFMCSESCATPRENWTTPSTL